MVVDVPGRSADCRATVGSSGREAAGSAGLLKLEMAHQQVSRRQGRGPTLGHHGAWPAGRGGWCQLTLAVRVKQARLYTALPTFAVWMPRELALVRPAGLPGSSGKLGLSLALHFLSTYPSSGHSPVCSPSSPPWELE